MEPQAEEIVVVRNDGIVYLIKDVAVELYSSETAYGWQTVGVIGDIYYQMGDDLINLETAINCWQEVNGSILSQEEIQKVMDINLPRLGA